MLEYAQCLIYIVIFQSIPCVENQRRGPFNTYVGYANTVSEKFQDEILKWAKQYTKYDVIENEFRKIENDLTYQNINGKDLNSNFVKGVETLFESKRKILEKIRNKANATKTTYRDLENIVSFDYRNIRKVNPDDNTTLVIDTSFSLNVKVNKTFSFVQVPTNIYSENNAVLNTANWTSELDKVFIENYRNADNTLLYQYYGDSSGLFRIYPGNLNGERNKDNVDLFDCRRRIWYIQASASPKDVVIVIDISGSMIGANIGIAKISAASLIDTLQENDFFNVITVNNTIKYLIDDVKYLVQATKENKETMKAELQKLGKPADIVNISLGMNEAFDILKLSGDKYNRSSDAGCNKAILFITDGVEGDYAGKEVFEKRNKDKGVRAFAFLVGRRKNPDNKALIEMACNNRGYFYTVETLGNIWDSVLKYLQVLSRPIGASKKQKPAYTSVYKDSTGVGMVMSVSLGVFGDNDLYGVAGTDIAVDSLIENIPQQNLGVFSHGILINNNGFISVHPKFRAQEGYLPDPANVYLDDIEYGVDTNDTANLKKAMIDGENDTMTFPIYWLYDSNRKAFEANMEFSYKSVKDTEFSAAIAVADSDMTYFVVPDSVADKFMADGLDALYIPVLVNKTENYTSENFTLVQISKWDYCQFQSEKQNSIPRSMKAYPTANELYNFIKTNNIKTAADIKNCDKDLLKRLLMTSGITHKVIKPFWNIDLFKKEEFSSRDIDAVYIATIAGYSKYFTYTNDTEAFGRDILKSGVFETASVFNNAKVTISTRSSTQKYANDDVKYVHLTGSARVGPSNILAAISGARVSSDLLYLMFKNATSSEDRCATNESAVCLVVDHNGFIVTSNQGNEATGQFMGKYLPALTEEHLANVNISIFKKVELLDTQAECSKFDKYEASAADILATPFRIIFTILSLIFDGVYTTLVYLTMLLMTFFTELSAELKTEEELKPKIQVSCIKTMPFYIFQEDKWKEFESDVNPERAIFSNPCTQQYALKPIKDTNLIFIIADYNPGCLRYRKVSLDHTVTENQEFYKRDERYRKRPSQCFNKSTQNENQRCGTGYMVKPSLFLIIIFLILHFTTLRNP